MDHNICSGKSRFAEDEDREVRAQVKITPSILQTNKKSWTKSGIFCVRLAGVQATNCIGMCSMLVPMC